MNPSGPDASLGLGSLAGFVQSYAGGTLFMHNFFHSVRETGNIEFIISCASDCFSLQKTPTGCFRTSSIKAFLNHYCIQIRGREAKAAIYYRLGSTLGQIRNSLKAHNRTTLRS